MTLYLDTTNFNKARLAIKDGDEIVAKREVTAGKNLSQNLLAEIDLLLTQNHHKIGNVKAVEVATKSVNTFTGTRVGITVANALGFALDVPVNGKKMVAAKYEREPNIS